VAALDALHDLPHEPRLGGVWRTGIVAGTGQGGKAAPQR